MTVIDRTPARPSVGRRIRGRSWSPEELSGHLSDEDRASYEVAYERRNAHDWGAGGVFEHRAVLRGPRGDSLVSVRAVAYLSYGDDSEDFPLSETRCTELLDPADPVAEAVFGRLLGETV